MQNEPSSPTISVVIPVHNKASHLARCLASIQAQTVAVREIIFVDDASTDGSREILRGFSDPRIKLVENDPPSSGPGGARNLGIRAASSTWIAFLDADDVWMPHFIATILSMAREAKAGVGILFTGFENDYDGRRVPHEFVGQYGHLGRRQLNFSGYLTGWLGCGRSPMHTSSAVIRRAVLNEVGLFPEGPNARRGQDIATWLKCIALTDAITDPSTCAVYFRQSENMVTKSTSVNVVPALCFVVRKIIVDRSKEDQDLLRRINNYILYDYARVARYLRGQNFDLRLLTWLYPWAGMKDVLRVLALVFTPLPLIKWLRRKRLKQQGVQVT